MYCFQLCQILQSFAKITRFSMKDCLSAPGLSWKYFISMRDENDEQIYTYDDKHMRHFLRLRFKGGRICAFNQYYKSKVVVII